jgi:hypothetical protein
MGGDTAMRKYIQIIIFSVIILICGCDSKIDYIELRMPQKNPSTYIFEASIDTIKNVIRRNHGKMPLMHIETATDSSLIWSGNVLTIPENKDDFYIYNILPVDTSIIFSNVEKPIPYSYSMHIHLVSASPERTLVTIKTINPEICVGVKFPHNVIKFGVPEGSLLKSVSPSTIEEYMVLLVIGEALGVKDKMPPLLLPERPSKK